MIATVAFNPAVDHTVTVESLRPDAVTRTESARYDAGGKGINVSKYLDALGVDTLATGLASGLTGQFLRERLGEAGVPSDFVETDRVTRMNTTILTPDARFKVNERGDAATTEDVDAVVERLRSFEPSVVVVAGSLPPGLGPAAVDRVAAAGTWETVVDLHGDVLRELEGSYALCTPNRSELAAATSMPVDSIADCRAAASALRERAFDWVVASLGAEGSISVTEATEYHTPAVDADVVDSSGAGDALLAGILSSRANGRDRAEAVAYGHEVAAYAVATRGTTLSVPE